MARAGAGADLINTAVNCRREREREREIQMLRGCCWQTFRTLTVIFNTIEYQYQYSVTKVHSVISADCEFMSVRSAKL